MCMIRANPNGLVVFDYECPCGIEERLVRRSEQDRQSCARGTHQMRRLLTGCGRQDMMKGYPYIHPTIDKTDVPITGPGHFKRLLKEKGLEVKHKGNGWTCNSPISP